MANAAQATTGSPYSFLTGSADLYTWYEKAKQIMGRRIYQRADARVILHNKKHSRSLATMLFGSILVNVFSSIIVVSKRLTRFVAAFYLLDDNA